MWPSLLYDPVFDKIDTNVIFNDRFHQLAQLDKLDDSLKQDSFKNWHHMGGLSVLWQKVTVQCMMNNGMAINDFIT